MDPLARRATSTLGDERSLRRTWQQWFRAFAPLRISGVAILVTRYAAVVAGVTSPALIWMALLSLFRQPTVPLGFKAAVAILSALAFFRPADAILILVGFVPLGGIVAALWGAPVRGPETLVLAFLGGYLLRLRPGIRVHDTWTVRQWTPAFLFGLVVVGSCLVQLSAVQIRTDDVWPFMGTLVSWTAREYLTQQPRFKVLADAAVLLEGAALMITMVAVIRGNAAVGPRLIRMFLAGGLALAILTFVRLATILLRSQLTGPSLAYYLSHGRLAFNSPDVNATASYFVLLFAVALGEARTRGRFAPAWVAGAICLAGAMWLTGSRAALVPALVITAGALAWGIVKGTRSRALRRNAVVLVAGVLALVLFGVYSIRGMGADARFALGIRLGFLSTTLRMLVAHPMFGAGIGQFFTVSSFFMPGWLQEIYRRENAHNNFLQILGELGVAGFAVFIWLIVDALRRAFSGFRPGRPDWRRAGLLAGISAFLLTWLSGHPLLTPDVAYAFWIALGTAVALGAVQQTRPVYFQRRRELWVGVCVVAVVCSVPVRIHNERQSANLTGVAYGVYGWETERDGTRFRWIRQNGTFFIPATAKAVEIPVRALHLDGNPGPTEVTLSIDGRLANALRLEDDRWVRTRILLPSAAPDARSRRIDVVVDHTWSVADGSDNRRLGIKVGELGVQVEKR